MSKYYPSQPSLPLFEKPYWQRKLVQIILIVRIRAETKKILSKVDKSTRSKTVTSTRIIRKNKSWKKKKKKERKNVRFSICYYSVKFALFINSIWGMKFKCRVSFWIESSQTNKKNCYYMQKFYSLLLGNFYCTFVQITIIFSIIITHLLIWL